MRYVLFDAVGTLIQARPAVPEIYAEFGRRFGSKLTQHDIKQRFAPALRGVGDLPREECERARWQKIVARVFDDLTDTRTLFEELWTHFAASQSWTLYEDVAETWALLTQRGFTLGIASNFDARLRQVCAGHSPLDCCQHLFISSELGHAKPQPDFFHEVARRLRRGRRRYCWSVTIPSWTLLPLVRPAGMALLIDRSLPTVVARSANETSDKSIIKSLGDVPDRLA